MGAPKVSDLFRLLAVFILPVLLVAAPAGIAAQSTPLEILFWYPDLDRVRESNQELVKSFNDSVGRALGIRVSAKSQGNPAELGRRLAAAAASGTAPDVSVVEAGILGPLIGAGAIASLDGLVERDRYDLSDFRPGLLRDSFIGGRLYALPFLRSVPVLYMNLDILRQAGLDVRGPADWKDLERYCRAIKERTGHPGLILGSEIVLYETFLLQAGTSLLAEDGRSCNIASEPALEAVRFFRRLSDEGLVRILSSRDLTKSIPDPSSLKCGMWYMSSAAAAPLGTLARLFRFELGAAPLPILLRGGAVPGGYNLAISAGLAPSRREAAWEFVKWMTASEQSVRSSVRTGYLPLRPGPTASEDLGTYLSGTLSARAALAQLSSAGGRRQVPSYPEVSRVILAALDAAWTEGRDVDAVFTAAASRCDALLAGSGGT